jgi:Fe-Mn family superoxide dismutase
MPLYTLPELPYAYDALAPHLSAKVLELHHDKHHAAYVKGANATVEALQGEVPDGQLPGLQRTLAFNLGGHVLHSVLWTCMAPPADAASRPEGELAAAVDEAFGSFESLQQRMSTAITTLQGSGWALLAWDPVGARLHVFQVHDHQNELAPGIRPLFAIDGWEHTYYLDYTNDKAAYLAGFWKVADWRAAGARFATVRAEPALART